ncbi:MFS transporter [Paenibacillus wynnii]|uniref:MFS transporter n=1 Tax=Paenibacillus wynnii TaxID=268407 RepID=UPI002790076F|nr:MFS transporter [Paenibacillus wynnii]MDQ0194269.1 MFS family permease [Paenibacillus wynnii]
MESVIKNKKQAFWSPLQRPQFRRLFIGQLLSDLANWLDFVALGTLLVYGWGQGSLALAALSVSMGLPWVIVGPLLSARCSQFSGRRLLILCDILRAFLLLGLIWSDSLAILLLFVFLKMSVSSVFDPIRQHAVKNLTEPDQWAQSSSLSQLSVNLMKIVGPMAGGGLLALWGDRSPFLIGACCYAISALVLFGLREWSVPSETKNEGKSKSVIHEAWQHVTLHPELKAGIIYSALLFFLIFVYDGLFVMVAKEAGMDESQFGLIIGSVGIGSVLGALAAGQWNGWQQHPLSSMTLAGMVTGVLVGAVGVGALGWFPNELGFWVMICILLGACGAFSLVPFGYLLQKETTDQTIVPVSALSNALQTGSMLIAPILGAFAAEWIRAGGVFLIVGCLTSLMAGIYRLRVQRTLKKRELL